MNVSTASAAAISAAPGQSMLPKRRSAPALRQTAISTGSAIGRLIQKTQRQPNHSVIAPPQSGPISAPASEAAAIAPRPSRRRCAGSSRITIAIATGTTAPPPTACSARDATSSSKVGESATSALPTMKTAIAAA